MGLCFFGCLVEIFDVFVIFVRRFVRLLLFLFCVIILFKLVNFLLDVYFVNVDYIYVWMFEL